MHRPLNLALGVAVAALAIPVSAPAQELSSVYTPLDLKKCKDVAQTAAKEYGTIWRCEGYEGISVHVAEDDFRIFVSFGPEAEQP